MKAPPSSISDIHISCDSSQKCCFCMNLLPFIYDKDANFKITILVEPKNRT